MIPGNIHSPNLHKVTHLRVLSIQKYNERLIHWLTCDVVDSCVHIAIDNNLKRFSTRREERKEKPEKYKRRNLVISRSVNIKNWIRSVPLLCVGIIYIFRTKKKTCEIKKLIPIRIWYLICKQRQHYDVITIYVWYIVNELKMVKRRQFLFCIFL